MLDQTPDVKWSNAWWQMILLGIVTPIIALIGTILAIANDTAFMPVFGGYRRFDLTEVHGAQATLVALAYLGIGIAAFAHGYARLHRRLGFYSDAIVGVGLTLTAICAAWSVFGFLR